MRSAALFIAPLMLGVVSSAPSPAAPGGCAVSIEIPILLYHRVDTIRKDTPAITRRLTVSPGDFGAEMRWLVRNQYRSVTQGELLAALRCRRPIGSKAVMITFDDGYRDVFFKASPILLRLRLHATAYVITGRISRGDPSFLTWPLLRALERRGIEIGSHTVSHVDLTTVPRETARRELLQSRATLEVALGHPVRWLAYPFGRYDERVLELARQSGYALAVTTRAGETQSSLAPLELSRFRVLDTTGVDGLAAMVRRR